MPDLVPVVGWGPHLLWDVSPEVYGEGKSGIKWLDQVTQLLRALKLWSAVTEENRRGESRRGRQRRRERGGREGRIEGK